MIDSTKLAGYLPDWGDWKMNRPRERFKDIPPPMVTGMPFGPKLPGPVWMTPHALLIDYLELTAEFEKLPEVQFLVIGHKYLEQLDHGTIAKRMGLKWESVTKHTLKGIDLMSAGMSGRRLRKKAA
jgi:hypothetical protein